MSKRSEEAALKAYPERIGLQGNGNAFGRHFYIQGYEQAEKDLDELRKNLYQSGYDDGYRHGQEDSQKHPEVDLEKEIREYFEGWQEGNSEEGCVTDKYQFVQIIDCHRIARRFYELGLNAKKK